MAECQHDPQTNNHSTTTTLLLVVEWQMTGMNDEILKIVTAVFIIRQV